MAAAFVQYGFARESVRQMVRAAWGLSYTAPSDAMPGLVAPDAHVEFVFQTGAPCATRLGDVERPSPRAMIFALRRGTLTLVPSGANAIIAFRVAPAVACVILRHPLTDCWDRPVALAELIGREADLLLARIAAAPLADAGRLLEAWLISRLEDWDGDDARQLDLQNHLLWRSVSESMSALADDIGLTARTLRRHCERSAGLSPKQIAMSGRILRSCIMLRDQRRTPIAAISHELGFSDQAAFTNAFRRHVGMTPAAFRAEPIVHCEGARG